MSQRKFRGFVRFPQFLILAVVIIAAYSETFASDFMDNSSDSVICGCAVVDSEMVSDGGPTVLIPVHVTANRPIENLFLNLLVNSEFFQYSGCNPVGSSGSRLFSTNQEAIDLEGGLQLIIVGLSDSSWTEAGVEQQRYQLDLQVRLRALTSEVDPRSGIPRGVAAGSPCAYAMVIYGLNASQPVIRNCEGE